MFVGYADRYLPSSWTVNSTQGGVDYKVDGGKIIIPLAGAYLVEITPGQAGDTNYYYTIQIWVNGKSRFSKKITYNFHSTISTILNL